MTSSSFSEETLLTLTHATALQHPIALPPEASFWKVTQGKLNSLVNETLRKAQNHAPPLPLPLPPTPWSPHSWVSQKGTCRAGVRWHLVP